MFTNKTAWFSNSVTDDIRHLWVSEGGAIVSWYTADYLFSSDASCSDTRRIFDSMEYAEDRVTVFHSSFISACDKIQSIESVLIGHYVLPPASVQKEVKAVVGRFIWEQEGNHNTVKNFRKETVDMKEDFCRPPDYYGHSIETSQEEIKLVTPQRENSQCCNVQQYPVNNMVTGYVFIDELKRYSGELHDFLPGHSGYFVCKAHN